MLADARTDEETDKAAALQVIFTPKREKPLPPLAPPQGNEEDRLTVDFGQPGRGTKRKREDSETSESQSTEDPAGATAHTVQPGSLLSGDAGVNDPTSWLKMSQVQLVQLVGRLQELYVPQSPEGKAWAEGLLTLVKLILDGSGAEVLLVKLHELLVGLRCRFRWGGVAAAAFTDEIRKEDLDPKLKKALKAAKNAESHRVPDRPRFQPSRGHRGGAGYATPQFRNQTFIPPTRAFSQAPQRGGGKKGRRV